MTASNTTAARSGSGISSPLPRMRLLRGVSWATIAKILHNACKTSDGKERVWKIKKLSKPRDKRSKMMSCQWTELKRAKKVMTSSRSLHFLYLRRGNYDTWNILLTSVISIIFVIIFSTSLFFVIREQPPAAPVKRILSSKQAWAHSAVGCTM